MSGHLDPQEVGHWQLNIQVSKTGRRSSEPQRAEFGVPHSWISEGYATECGAAWGSQRLENPNQQRGGVPRDLEVDAGIWGSRSHLESEP